MISKTLVLFLAVVAARAQASHVYGHGKGHPDTPYRPVGPILSPIKTVVSPHGPPHTSSVSHHSPPSHLEVPYQPHQPHKIEHANYAYEYKVNDPHYGDNKYQHETSNGGVVKGVYSLLQPDGTWRIVEYTADEHNGFQANVRFEHQKPM